VSLARVHIDPETYKAYLADLSRADARIRQGLQTSGQSAFELRYEDLKNPQSINGLAAFLGVSERIGAFDEPIKRQNPEPLREKIENYAQIAPLLGAGSNVSSAVQASDAGNRFPNAEINDILVSSNLPILFAPIPGTARGPMVSWLKQLSKEAPLKGMDLDALEGWLDKSVGLTAFSVTEPPLSRIYRVFQRRIFGSDHGYPHVRQRLISNFGLRVPKGEPSVEETREGFLSFLRFLEQNLNEQTGLRIDGEWDLQSRHLAALNQITPLTNIVSSDAFPDFAQSVSRRFGQQRVEVQRPGNGGGIALKQITTDEIRALAAKIYADDYKKLGFARD